MNEEERNQIDKIDRKMNINRVYRLLNRVQLRNFCYHNALHSLNEKNMLTVFKHNC